MANNVDMDEGIQDASQKHPDTSVTKALWDLFSQMKTAIVLLFTLAIISILGTIITQNASPEKYLAIYGANKYAIIKILSLNNVYEAWYYKLLLALVGVNLTVCSLNRFGLTWRRAFQPNVRAGADCIDKMQRSEIIKSKGTISEAADKVFGVLHASHYRVIRDDGADDVVMFASRGRLSLWGPYMTHLSLLVIFIGAIFGNFLGFNGFTAITEGGFTTTYGSYKNENESNLGFKVGLRKFEIGHDAKGNPTSYKSDLQVYEGDKIVAEKVIDVNHPLTYKGVSFFQSDYGLSGLVVKIKEPNGRVTKVDFEVATENGPYGKTFVVSGEMFKQVSIGGKTLTIFVHDLVSNYTGNEEMSQSSLPINPAVMIMLNDKLPEYKELDAWTKLGWLEVGKSAQYKSLTVTLDDVVDYTGLQVSKNPGLPIIYLGFGLLLAGIFLSFYVSYRTIRIRISESDQRLIIEAGASSRDDNSAFDSTFKRLRDALTS